ncbi:MAG: hypothetical protein ACOCY6_01725 [Halodesulfurarchaeum sp.]
MDRRTLLQALGGTATVAIAGCLGGRSAQPFKLSVIESDFGEGPDGNLEVVVIVSNSGNEKQSGRIIVRSNLNEEPVVREEPVTLDAHETTTETITYDIAYENVSSFDVDESVEPLESGD